MKRYLHDELSVRGEQVELEKRELKMSVKMTPMMEQYQRIRRQLPANTILLFRLGDFYEMFFDDAKEAASILNVALTKRNGMPMCGVPYHAAEGYRAKLIRAGKRVAICEQVGEPQAGKIVEREITQIISPGTVSDENLLQMDRPNYLVAIWEGKQQIGVAVLDVSTGELHVTETSNSRELLDELARIGPSEILVSEDQEEKFKELKQVAVYDGYVFREDFARHFLLDHFKVQSLDGFGCRDMPVAVSAAGAVLHYVHHQLRRKIDHVLGLRAYRIDTYVDLGQVTQEHLELVQTRNPEGVSLLRSQDRTKTPMGARKLREWILHPLRDLTVLQKRQHTVAALLQSRNALSEIRERLKGIRDIERTMGRLSQTSGNARDLQALRVSLEILPELRRWVGDVGTSGDEPSATRLPHLLESIHEFPELVEHLGLVLVEEPPATLKEGGIFRDGVHEELDTLRSASREGKNWIASLQQKEIERTGVKSLKIRYNAVFGYYIEITKSNLRQVPEEYQRKQTMANAERFITPELKEVEGKILGADERAKTLEAELFQELRARVLESLRPVQLTAAAVAELDVLASMAEMARLYDFCQPELSASTDLEILDGRHPVLDQSLTSGKFVPNDTILHGETDRLMLITGPNMAGKSTYIRQVALLVLLAQTGSFIPAKSARIGLVDKIFTRVGANDDLARGQSTFMVEMNETATIINNATEYSLVILDEIGRGTSTFDGLSLAWSIAEYLYDVIQARVLFATHYHELTDLAETREGVRNYNVAVREWNEEIVFLHKIMEGRADKSYGIQVAKLAGLPDELLGRAKEILVNLEAAELQALGKKAIPANERTSVKKARRSQPEGQESPKMQLRLFE